MSKKAKGKPWHSKESTVHHDNSMCAEGKRIYTDSKEPGKSPIAPSVEG